MRNLSAAMFRDSKKLENLKSYILEILNIIRGSDELWDEYLLSNGVLKNPNYIYVKGSAIVQINNQFIDLKELNTSLAICSDSIQNTKLISIDGKQITTIENLTTYHDYKGEGLIMYLGGFSNHSKVELLKKLNKDINNLNFRHFGDIDFGGFSILSHLRRETNIQIESVHMDIDTLQQREELSKKPTSVYLKKLKSLLEDNYLQDCKDNYLQDCKDILNYMIEHEIILEQETY